MRKKAASGSKGQLGQGITIRACASVLGSDKGVNFFLKKTLAKDEFVVRVIFFPGTTFLHINGA